MSVFACSDADEQTVQKSKICGLSMWHWDDIDDVIITNNYIWHNLLCRLQLFNMAIKCGLGQSWKPKVKPNLVCYSNIAIGMPYISDCVSSWYPNIWRSYSRLSVLVTTYSYWPRGPWILICVFRPCLDCLTPHKIGVAEICALWMILAYHHENVMTLMGFNIPMEQNLTYSTLTVPSWSEGQCDLSNILLY